MDSLQEYLRHLDSDNQMTESSLKGQLMPILSAVPWSVAIRHEEHFTSGVPDISFTMNHFTSWWEVKYGTPMFKSRHNQELMMLELGLYGHAFYIVYMERKGVRSTHIVQPQLLNHQHKWDHEFDGVIDFDHQWVVARMTGVHT